MLEEPPLRYFVERLASVARLIRMDRRGLGPSDPVSAAEPPTLESRAADATAVLGAVSSAASGPGGQADTSSPAVSQRKNTRRLRIRHNPVMGC
jgi:hypothetical protein